jgi:hypothetical protein
MTVVVTALDGTDPRRRDIRSHQEWWLEDFSDGDAGMSEVASEVDAYLGHIAGPDLVVLHVTGVVPLERVAVGAPGGGGPRRSARTGYKSSAMYHGDFLKYLSRL